MADPQPDPGLDPGPDPRPDPHWLSPEEQAAWRALVAIMIRLPAALDSQLRRDSDLTHFDFSTLVILSEAPDRRLPLIELARLLSASLSRLSHVLTKLEDAGWLRRERTVGGRSSWAVLTDAGYATVQRAAPGHVENVRDLIFDGLDEQQVVSLAEIGRSMIHQMERRLGDQGMPG